ncbi:MAG: serine/threonine protein kinase [Planctomycetota bacterium]
MAQDSSGSTRSTTGLADPVENEQGEASRRPADPGKNPEDLVKLAAAAAEEAAAKRAAARAAHSRALRSSQEAERERKRAGDAAARVLVLSDRVAGAEVAAEEARAAAESAREEALRLADIAEDAEEEADRVREEAETARDTAEESAARADELLEDAQTAICAARDEEARVETARREADEAAGRASDAGSASEEAEARAEVLEFEAAEAEEGARKLAAEAAELRRAAELAAEEQKKREEEEKKRRQKQKQKQEQERVHDSTVELSAEEAGKLLAERKKTAGKKAPSGGRKRRSTAKRKRVSAKKKRVSAKKKAQARANNRTTQTARPAAVEMKVPGYELLGQMGGDDLGVLYRARQSNMNRLVILRVLRSDRAYDQPSVKEFLRQSRLAGQFCHANVVRVHELGRSGVLHFCSMEYVEGNTLEKMVAGAGAFDLRRACHMIRDLATALTHWERRKLAYGDLVPARVLLDSGRVPKIAWLGLAAGAGLGDAGSPGRVNFLAPEVVDEEAVDSRADVYTLGALLFFAATGTLPHDEDSVEKVVGSAKKGPLFLRSAGERLPRPVSDVIRKAMQPKPKLRYPKLAPLIGALDGVLASKVFKRPAPKRPTSATVRPARRRRRRR